MPFTALPCPCTSPPHPTPPMPLPTPTPPHDPPPGARHCAGGCEGVCQLDVCRQDGQRGCGHVCGRMRLEVRLGVGGLGPGDNVCREGLVVMGRLVW